ncbi:glycosyl hydrolase family 61 protein [Colletotrichum truncatum]|uniref:Glycosyl hydrolase family 61 protein n=1 Tax=Colletotrichum truncatum TaxID=5467 RepID=A0ACC3ZK31_COLTU|nr:glycosyl hydrolase family 61 protein [Colletotrichum truncatum]KAF6799871.1 glycosyl hydrolase family 61 protein [Colletotrichum truncatum]
MRSTCFETLVVAATLPSCLAHYNHEALIINGIVTPPYEYVRRSTNGWSPVANVTSLDMVCNEGGLNPDTMAKTKTAKVAPGDLVGFTVNIEIGHPGPLAVYMSKAPNGVQAKDYKGDGDWFKVYAMTVTAFDQQTIHWANYKYAQAIRNYTFELPHELPAGQYLMRAEHIGLHDAVEFGKAQFYISCAQLEVTGSGSGQPAPTVKIPGVYDGNEPGIKINLFSPVPTTYEAPGPVTWPHACEDRSANILGESWDGDCGWGKLGGGSVAK